MIDRVTSGVQFNTGISNAEWTSGQVGQASGQTQHAILPGSTTVSEALAAVFPKDVSISGEIMVALAAMGNSTALRSQNGFGRAARKAIKNLKNRSGLKSGAADRAAAELEGLLADTELLEMYRASLLET